MGEVVTGIDFRGSSDTARARFQRRRANLAADRAFWKGGPEDLTMGHPDTAPCEYAAPDSDPA